MTRLYPQLASGAVAQFPLQKSYRVLSTINLQEDGSRYTAAASDPLQLSWVLPYKHITMAEANTLQEFFGTVRGRLLPFTFLDPAGNLLAWSEDLTNAVWQKTPLTVVTGNDNRGVKTFQLASGASGSATVSQVLPCPATALVCFSLFARADQPVVLTLSVTDASGAVEKSFELGSAWQQFYVTQTGFGNSIGKTAALSFPQGSQAHVSRLTASPQPAPGAYITTAATSGLMTKTRFDQDSFLVTALGANDYACDVRLTSWMA